jgi:integrase/recombinase XerD
MTATELRARLDSYLALRRALGFAMRPDERLLRSFIACLEQRGLDGPLRAQSALEWATGIRSGPGHQAHRLTVARGFLTHLRALDPQVEVPGPGLLGRATRPVPHLYTATDIAALLGAARALGPQDSLRPHTMATLIGLLASCGLRAREALRLRLTDVDLDAQPPRLLIRQTKFRKSRIVPLHATTAAGLRDYAAHRKILGYDDRCDTFFVSHGGAPLTYRAASWTFAGLARRLGLRGPVGVRGVSLRHLRHTFAVERLAAWSRAGADVRARLPELSVYLGHTKPQNTYWYLTATPPLLEPAAARFDAYASGDGAR